MSSNKQVPTLYEWAGGEPAISGLFERFYSDVVPKDPVLEPIFRHKDPEHFEIVAEFVCEALGGPKTYSETHGLSHATMVAKHIGKKLTEEQRFRWMTQLLATADALGLPDDPEFWSALVGYLEWGSRIARVNFHGDKTPIAEDAPMPTWGWGDPGDPYQPD